MSNSVDSVRILGEAIELAEMLEVLSQNAGAAEGGFPIGGVRLTLRQVTEQMRIVRADLIQQSHAQLLSEAQRTASPEIPRVAEPVNNHAAVSGHRPSTSLASRLKPAPTLTGRVRDIPTMSGASEVYSGERGAQ